MTAPSSAETLRRAASLMRERLDAASAMVDGTADVWRVEHQAEDDRCAVTVRYDNIDGKTQEGDVIDPVDCDTAAHIASWHPTVALSVADLLDVIARSIEEAERGDRLTAQSRLALKIAAPEALAVARAYLGDP